MIPIICGHCTPSPLGEGIGVSDYKTLRGVRFLLNRITERTSVRRNESR